MAFALNVITITRNMSSTEVSRIVRSQLLRSATSVGANYRSACSAKSRADFLSKMAIVQEECDESLYWMELLIMSGEARPGTVDPLIQEAREILAMVVSSIKTARSHS
jgi:four helix bundle protein